MVDGELVIGASMDTQALESGITALNSSIDRLGDKFDSLNSDMERTEKSAKGISLGFVSAAAAGSVLFGISRNAPALAGSMAEIEVSLMDLTMTLGESLAPAFEVAADGLNRFGDWVSDNQPLIDSLGESISGGLTLAVEGLAGAWKSLESIGIPSAIKWMSDNFGPEIVLALAGGKIGGLPGAAVGFAGGSVIKDTLAGEEPLLGESLAAIGIIGGGVAGPLGSIAGGAIGFGLGEGIEELISFLIGNNENSQRNKSASMNSTDNMIYLN